MIKKFNAELPLAAILLIFASPPFPTGIFAWIALVPIFFYLEKASPKDAFRKGLFFGLIWTTGTVYWIAWSTVVGFLGTLIIVPLYSGLFFILAAWIKKYLKNYVFWIIPFLWTGVEILSSWGLFAFPWNLLGYTQTFSLEFLQIANITGVFSVSFLVVVINVLFFLIAKQLKKGLRPVALSVALLLIITANWLYGYRQMQQTSIQEHVNISLIQGNIDPQKKWTSSFKDSNFAIYHRLTAFAADSDPDLVVWPETAAPTYLAYRIKYLRPIKKQLEEIGAPLLTGAPDYRWIEKGVVEKYNSALFIQHDRWNIQRYHKNNLVPFSERVPGVEHIPFLLTVGNYFKLGMGNFNKGESPVLFSFNLPRFETETRFSSFICYDSVFPSFVRDCVSMGAEFLVLITNDGWFGNTSGPYQHAKIAVLRAIENRIWIARCANTGISSFIDPMGRIHASTKLNTEAVLNSQVGLSKEKSFYTKNKGLFIKSIQFFNGCLIIVIFFMQLIYKRKKLHAK
ncbi:apolipoprotein N-acyltransferase [bacterium]|nr:apolipoprotein N-acyltransferase [bacterium]